MWYTFYWNVVSKRVFDLLSVLFEVSHLPPRVEDHTRYEALLRAHFTKVVSAQRAAEDQGPQDGKVSIVEVAESTCACSS